MPFPKPTTQEEEVWNSMMLVAGKLIESGQVRGEDVTEILQRAAVISILGNTLRAVRKFATAGNQDANFACGLVATAIALIQSGNRNAVNKMAGVLLEYGFEIEKEMDSEKEGVII